MARDHTTRAYMLGEQVASRMTYRYPRGPFLSDSDRDRQIQAHSRAVRRLARKAAHHAIIALRDEPRAIQFIFGIRTGSRY